MFGAGTVQWSWGLDSHHDRGSDAAGPRHAAGDGEPVRRHGRRSRTRLQPRPRRRRRRRPTPRRRPRMITFPADGGVAPERQRGHDHRHGRRRGRRCVGGVEVSIDGGTTWHRATGTSAAGAIAWTPGAHRLGHDPEPGGRRQREPRDARRPAITRHGRTPRHLPVHDLERPFDARHAVCERRRGRRARGEVPVRRRRASSPASASTRAPRTPGTHTGHLWTSAGTLLGDRPRSPARPRRAGSR